MAFLKILGKIIEYKDAEEATKIIRNHAINYILNWKHLEEKLKNNLEENQTLEIKLEKKEEDKKEKEKEEVKELEIVLSKTEKKESFKDEKKHETKFGYEFEIMKVNFDDKEKKVRLDLSGEIDIRLHADREEKEGLEFAYQPEYAKYMVEVIPKQPFSLSQLNEVESSMEKLNKDFDINLGKGNYIYSSIFPFLGVGDDYYKLPDLDNSVYYPTAEDVESEIKHREDRKDNKYSQSEYVHDVITSNHPRFETFTSFCRKKTGKKQDIFIPIYVDKNTFNDVKDEKYPGYIHGDAFAFGMGNGCFQMTTGVESFEAACYVYDQLIPLMPILNAITASSPFFKGKLSKYDNRYYTIYQGCDERFESEKDPLNERYIFTSRYSYIYSYISDNQYIQDHHNNLPKMPINKEYYDRLIKEGGFSPRFATHLCNLLVRDAKIIFEDAVKITDPLDSTNFVNFLSSNWNALRFKPPNPSDKDHLYKIEIRPCDLQMTELENASIVTFVMLYIELIKNYDVNFILPLNLSEENFNNSVLNDSCSNGRFYWRTNGIIEKKHFNELRLSHKSDFDFEETDKEKEIDYRNSNLEKHKYLKNENPLPKGYVDKDEDLKNIKLISLSEILDGVKPCMKSKSDISQFNKIIDSNYICSWCKHNNSNTDCSSSNAFTLNSQSEKEELEEINACLSYFNKDNNHYKGLLTLMMEHAMKIYEGNPEKLKTVIRHLKFIQLKAQGKFFFVNIFTLIRKINDQCTIFQKLYS